MSATVVFLLIGGFALLLLLLSLIGGGHLHLGHFHLGHLHLGHLHLGHLHLGHPSTGQGGGTELSVPVISGFLGAFGFGAAIVASLLPGRGRTGVLVAVAAGLLAAVPTGWLVGRLVNAAMNMLHRRDADQQRPDRRDRCGDHAGTGRRVRRGPPRRRRYTAEVQRAGGSGAPARYPGLRDRGTHPDQRSGRVHPAGRVSDRFSTEGRTMSPLVIAIGGAVLLVLLLVMFVLSRIKVAGPNEAFIVTGRKGRAIRAADGTRSTDLSGQKVVMGASVFVHAGRAEAPAGSTCPAGASTSRSRARSASRASAATLHGGRHRQGRRHRRRDPRRRPAVPAPAGARSRQFTREVLAGALRSIVGRLTVEEIIRDRAAFASRGRRGGRALDDQPGPGAGHVPAPGHPRRGYLPAGSRPAGGGPGAQGRPPSPRRGPGRRRSRSGCWPRRRSPRPSATCRSSRPRSRPRSTPPRRARRRPARSPRPSATRRSCPSSRRSPSATRNSSSASSTPRSASRPTRPATRSEQEAEAARNAAVFDADAPAAGHHRRRAGRRPSRTG